MCRWCCVAVQEACFSVSLVLWCCAGGLLQCVVGVVVLCRRPASVCRWCCGAVQEACFSVSLVLWCCAGGLLRAAASLLPAFQARAGD